MIVQSVGRGSSFLFRLRRMMAAEELAILRLEGQDGVRNVIAKGQRIVRGLPDIGHGSIRAQKNVWHSNRHLGQIPFCNLP